MRSVYIFAEIIAANRILELTMKYRLLSTTILLLACAGCDRPETSADRAATGNAVAAPADASADTAATSAETADAMPVASDTATPDTAALSANSNDSLALGLLGAVNQNEIAVAKQAMDKGVSGSVLAYAQKMDKEHSDNLAKTRSLGPLADASEVKTLQDKGKSELDALGKKTGKDYEAAYVQAMVKDHTEALSLIDDRLLGLAVAEPVTQHLTETRKHVAMHLDEAKKLQRKK